MEIPCTICSSNFLALLSFRSVDSSPRKGILKTTRITDTSTVRITGEISADPSSNYPTDTWSRDSEPTTSTLKDDEVDWTPYLTKSSTSTVSTLRPEKPKEQVFKLPTRYRVQQDVDLEREGKTKSLIFTRRWKSEPSLVAEKSGRRSTSVDRLSSERGTKLSNVKIDLIKPIDLRPLKPAQSIGDLPSHTTVRTETTFQMQPQRWKSNPELATVEKLDETHYRKPTRDLDAKIVRALSVHLQPLHQPKPPKETTAVKTTEVKDASMQFTTSRRETKSEGTQVRLDPSPPLTVSTEQDYKSTQTDEQPERIHVRVPPIVEFHTSEDKKYAMKPLHAVRSYDTKEPDTRMGDSHKKQQASDKIVVEYVKEPRKPKMEERMEMEIQKGHATEVRFRRDERVKTKQTIHVGRIDDIEMESLTSEVRYIMITVRISYLFNYVKVENY